MMRQLLSALIIAALLTGPALTANAGGGGPLTVDELNVKVEQIQAELLTKIGKLEGQLKTANARIHKLEGQLAWYEKVVFPAKWEQINIVASKLGQLEAFAIDWIGQNSYKLDLVWAWWGQYQNVPDAIANDLNWLASQMNELYEDLAWYNYEEVGGLGKVLFVNAPVVFKNKTDHQDESYFKVTAHFEEGFVGSDPLTGTFSSDQIGVAITQLSWIADYVYAGPVGDLIEWATPLMEIMYGGFSDLGDAWVVFDSIVYTDALWSQNTYLADSITWTYVDQGEQVTYSYSISQWLLYLFGQFPEGPGPIASSGGGGGGGGGGAPAPTP